MNNRLKDKAVLVTGASSGIGKACVYLLTKAGCQVWASVRKREDGDGLSTAVTPSPKILLMDICDRNAIRNARQKLEAELGSDGLYGLVNNAGIGVPGPVELLPYDLVKAQFEINVVAQIDLTQQMLPLLRQGRGRIVNISSVAGRLSFPQMGVYSGSKKALEAVSEAMSHELRRSGVRVTLVEPGLIRTPLFDKGNEIVARLEREARPDVLALYRPLVDRMRKNLKQANQKGIAPERVARAVLGALRASNPPLRKIVGLDAFLTLTFQSFIPSTLWDFSVRRIFGC